MSTRRLTNVLATVLMKALAKLPLPTVHAIGCLLGLVWAVFPTQPRLTTRRNLERCFPDWSPAERRRVERASLIETGKALAEAGPLWLWPPERIRPLIQEGEGCAELRATLAAGQGAIMASPHLGAWEVAGLYCSLLGPITSMYRPPRLAAVGALARPGRERLGARLVPADATGIRSQLQALKRHEMVGILPDQDPGRENGIFVPFFGVPANTMTLLSRLAIRSGAPVFLIYAQRLPRGGGYRIVCKRAPSALNEEPLQAAVAALNREVEAAVRVLPEQYLWSYKRFRRKPLQR